MSGDYEQYGADDLPWELQEVPYGEDASGTADGVTLAPTEGGWCVLVEFTADLDAAISRVAVVADDLESREAATAAAQRQAFEFAPPHPLRPQSREVFEVADGYLVVVHGAMKDYSFSVRVARFAGVRAHA